jgi:pyruvate/2-oxoglutarate dehydrogenase complex dihydrolipoamide dehydrogenase (E3) component
MAKKFDAIVIGTGQSGPSLAARISKEGQSVAIIERDRFGGSCVNFGCTPTKALVASAKAAYMIRHGEEYGIRVRGYEIDMPLIRARKERIVAPSREGVEQWLRGLPHCEVFTGQAYFESPHQVRVKDEVLEGKQIFLNVGARAAIPQTGGLDAIPYLTNISVLDLNIVPPHLLILGGGYIALEFAQIFCRFGSKVTIIQRNRYLMPKEDTDISTALREILQSEGVEIFTQAQEARLLPQSREGAIQVEFETPSGVQRVQGSHLLVAVGRIPNTDNLGVEKAGLKLDAKRYIVVDDRLRTSVPHIWAMGDCNGRGAFTHTSYHEYQILAENLFENGKRRVTERLPIYALYTDPPLGRVGLTEQQVRAGGRPALMATMPMTRVARAREKGETQGFMKILVDRESKQILGASLLGTGCDEVVQMVAEIMYARAPYTVLERGVLIHPTVSELVPTLLEQLAPL